LAQQASHIDITVAPTARFKNLETECRKGREKYGGKPPYKVKRRPWQVDIDTVKLVLNHFWRMFPFFALNGASDAENFINIPPH
jgi:hypothetical protein